MVFGGDGRGTGDETDRVSSFSAFRGIQTERSVGA